MRGGRIIEHLCIAFHVARSWLTTMKQQADSSARIIHSQNHSTRPSIQSILQNSMTEPSSSHLPVNPNPNPNPTETIQTLLQSLLQSQTLTYPQPTAAYLHPYAPLPQSRWKGKARAVDAICSTQDQLEVAHRLKECVNAARNVLNGVGKEDRGGMKLARALKEVYVSRQF